MPRSETINPKEHALGYPENTFLGLEFDAIFAQFSKGALQIGHEMVNLLRLHHDVIYVGLDGVSNYVIETLFHAALAGRTSVFQAERHRNVAIRSEWCDERGRELVGFFHRNLMVPGVHI